MDSDTSSFIFSPVNFISLSHQGKGEESAIDLGLSLRTMRHQPHQLASQKKYEGYENSASLKNDEAKNNDFRDEDGRNQCREKWTYVKVNMDGVIVGRKICILYKGGYSSLALQLEDMFGCKSVTGLRLFQAGSEFSLFYKDNEENWRSVGDIAWNEFVECVKRLRIAPRG